MGRVGSFLKMCIEVSLNPGKAAGFVSGWGTPVAIWLLSGVFFFWPIGFAIGADSLHSALVMFAMLSLLGVPLMGFFWINGWMLSFWAQNSPSTSQPIRNLDEKGLFKLVGICFSPVLIGVLLNLLAAIMSFGSPFAPLPNLFLVILFVIYSGSYLINVSSPELKNKTFAHLILWHSVIFFSLAIGLFYAFTIAVFT